MLDKRLYLKEGVDEENGIRGSYMIKLGKEVKKV